jgi:hypothetical protein
MTRNTRRGRTTALSLPLPLLPANKKLNRPDASPFNRVRAAASVPSDVSRIALPCIPEIAATLDSVGWVRGSSATLVVAESAVTAGSVATADGHHWSACRGP